MTAPRGFRAALRLGVLLLAVPAGAGGCRDITHFSTAEGEAYCGRIVQATFVRRGFADSVRMRMTFDADHLSDRPGRLTTDDLLLQDVPMRPMPELWHDPLSTLAFGEGRDRNLLYAVDPADPARGPTVLVVLSLLRDGDAEVRLVRGAPALDDAPTSASDGEALFGVFSPLRKQADPCGF